jgi:hypothetical protein
MWNSYVGNVQKSTFLKVKMKRENCDRVTLWGLITVLTIACSGCAQYRARKHLEGVAKGWCETIRASQVIPVYPLTEDLLPGDVFMVQTTIESQVTLYRAKGFLSLDDHRTRLGNLNFSKLYFDGYWKDSFGNTPHEPPDRPNPNVPVTMPRGVPPAAVMPPAAAPPAPLPPAPAPPVPVPPVPAPPAPAPAPVITPTFAPAPRAAFPTYTIAAKSGFGLSLAIPVKGVPVGLNYLRTDQVKGSVTISDARTYAADQLELYRALLKWARQDDVRSMLSRAVETDRPIFMRVVSRVYLTGGVIVSLIRSDAEGAGLEVGKAPKVSLVNPSGNLDANYTNVLAALDKEANAVTALKDAGGAIKFVGASESSVTLAESFDRLLAIGYLAFDVPIYGGGDLGMPIPTFERLNGRIKTPPTRVGALTIEQSRFKVNEAALEALANSNPSKAMNVISSVLNQLKTREFAEARKAFRRAKTAKDKPDAQEKFAELLAAFKEAAMDYVTLAGSQGVRYAQYDEVFARAWVKAK